MSLDINIRVDSQMRDMIAALRIMGRGILPHTFAAIGESMGEIQTTWINTARTTFNKPTGRYIHGIEAGVMYPYEGNPMIGMVVNTFHPVARYLEDGYGPFDMKKALDTSKQVRMSKPDKHGNRHKYLIIPFRHGTPDSSGQERATLGTMPPDIYELARNLAQSQRLSSYKEPSPNQGEAVRHTYAWGDRITQMEIIEKTGADWGSRSKMVADPRYYQDQTYTWKSSPYAGMVRMQSGPEPNRSTYMTFRVMSETSDPHSWWHPGIPAYRVAQRARDKAMPNIVRRVRIAFEQDVAGMA